MAEATENLYEGYGEYVAKVSCKAAKPFFGSITREEAIQVGWVAFLRAVERYDGSIPLEAYAYQRVHGAVLDEVRKLNTKHTSDGWVDNGKCSIENLSGIRVDELLTHSDKHYDVGILKILSGMQCHRRKKVIELHYLCDMSFTEIGVLFGVSGSRISQYHKEAVEQLQTIHCM